MKKNENRSTFDKVIGKLIERCGVDKPF